MAGEGDGSLVGLTLSQWLILGLPCIVWLRSQRYDIKASLGLRRPPLVYILAATAWAYCLVSASLLASIFSSPGSDEAARQMASQLFPADSSFIGCFLVAITPAVCEELLVRGVLLRAFQTRFRARTVALITGVVRSLPFIANFYRLQSLEF